MTLKAAGLALLSAAIITAMFAGLDWLTGSPNGDHWRDFAAALGAGVGVALGTKSEGERE